MKEETIKAIAMLNIKGLSNQQRLQNLINNEYDPELPYSISPSDLDKFDFSSRRLGDIHKDACKGDEWSQSVSSLLMFSGVYEFLRITAEAKAKATAKAEAKRCSLGRMVGWVR